MCCWFDHFLIKKTLNSFKTTEKSLVSVHRKKKMRPETWTLALKNMKPQENYFHFRKWYSLLISHQEGNGWVFLGEALHLLQHPAEDWHHPSLVLALSLERPLGAILLETERQRGTLLARRCRASQCHWQKCKWAQAIYCSHYRILRI